MGTEPRVHTRLKRPARSAQIRYVIYVSVDGCCDINGFVSRPQWPLCDAVCGVLCCAYIDTGTRAPHVHGMAWQEHGRQVLAHLPPQSTVAYSEPTSKRAHGE
jgi:hypothetical protein